MYRCGTLEYMGSAEERWVQRSRSFGAIAREYDRVRPSYPAAMIDDIAGLVPGKEIAEIGAGTGKATLLFASRGLQVTSIEPDAAMAAVLAERVASQQDAAAPAVRIVVSSFEDWLPDRLFAGVVAAQAWHWTRAESRYLLAARAMRPGGLLALFWNVTDWPRTTIRDDIDEIYRRHGMTSDNNRRTGHSQPDDWPRLEMSTSPAFTGTEVRSYPWERTYSTSQWLDYIGSTSDHLVLPAARRTALLADVRQVIDAHGGELHTFHRCDLYLAWRTDIP
jgi:SAM-dependent methyltransferase